MLNPERIAQLRELDPDQHLIYLCLGCGHHYPELVAETEHDLECPHCEMPLETNDDY